MIRRAIGTTLAGICVLAGPCAISAQADDVPIGPALTLSASSARQGVPFTVTGAACPSDDGEQAVQFSFTDSAGLIYPLGEADTDEGGVWTSTSLALPVAGIDGDGAWQDNGTATGLGALTANCVVAGASDDPGDDDPGDDPGDDGGDLADVVTLTYAATALTVVGNAAQFTVSASANGTVTVTPAESCVATGAADVTVAVVGVGDSNATDDPIVTGSATTSASGVWTPVTLTLPDDATGDYAVTAECSQGDDDAAVVTTSYDAIPLALGTVLLSKPVCTAKGAVVTVGGTYSDDVTSAGKPVKQDRLRLDGAGPWKVALRSAETNKLLVSQAVTCATPMFDLQVSRPSVNDKGQVRTKVCNSGRAGVAAVLTVNGKIVDKESLDPGDCTVLTGGKLRKGDDAKGKVLADPPGGGQSDADVATTFNLHRGKH